MKNQNKKIEELLKKANFASLDLHEAEEAWLGIAKKIDQKPVPSPWLQVKLNKKTMIPLLIAAMLFTGIGGTAVLANEARPGDTLFTVDRAIEDLRIAIANEEKVGGLKAKFAEERIIELEKLIAEARAVGKLSTSTNATHSTSSGQASTSATSTQATSTPKQNPGQATSTKATSTDKVLVGVNAALSFLNKVSADVNASSTEAARIAEAIKRLESLVNQEDVRVKIKNNGGVELRVEEPGEDRIRFKSQGNKERLEIREDGEMLRIEIKKDGQVRIKTGTEDDSDDDDKNRGRDRSNKSRGNNVSSKTKLEIGQLLDLEIDASVKDLD